MTTVYIEKVRNTFSKFQSHWYITDAATHERLRIFKTRREAAAYAARHKWYNESILRATPCAD